MRPSQAIQRRLPELQWIRDSQLVLLVVGLLLTVLVVVLFLLQPVGVRKADWAVYDLMLAGRTMPPQSPVPVLVGIDEESLVAFGQWPWPRYRLAKLVARLQSLGANVVALDFLMPEIDRTSPEVIEAERQWDMAGRMPIRSEGSDRNSRDLAEVLARHASVLGYYLDFVQAKSGHRPLQAPSLPEGMVLRVASGTGVAWPQPQGMLRSLPLLSEAAAAEGFTNALDDFDGTLRRVPLLLSPEGQARPSLALTALLLASSQRTLEITQDGAGSILRWNGRRIPLDARGNLLLDFRNQAYPYLSARAVLHDEVPPGSLRGKIVLVGAWATGLGDRHVMPSGRLIQGVSVHATVIDNILSGTLMARPDWAGGVELVVILIGGLLCTLLLARSGFALSLLFVVVGAGCCYFGASYLLVSRGVFLSPLMPIATLVLMSSVLSLLKYGIEARRVRLRTQELVEAQDEVIVSMSVLAETRDKETGGHIRRTQRYVEILARQLARTPKYSHLKDFDIALLAKSAPLHDIGKVGVPDSILQKPGKLSDDEFAIMQSHTRIGADALTRIVAGSEHPENHEFLRYAREMTESHHERWDGSGYPNGLYGEAIPLAGRLMALADVYDALISRRVYKAGLLPDDVRNRIVEQSGKQFDPDVVAAFLAVENEFREVARRFADGE